MSDESVVDFLTLERIEIDIFRGKSKNLGTPQVYGGQVLGQALAAAQATIEGREVHSVHAYFLRAGDFDSPIIYQVHRNRDGKSYSSRTVVAIQHGNPIFTMSASFQVAEEGLDYFESPLSMPAPPTDRIGPEPKSDEPQMFVKSNFGIYLGITEQVKRVSDGKEPTDSFRWWFKLAENLDAPLAQQKSLLAYISDFGLIGVAAKPHGYNMYDQKEISNAFMFASIDHAVWFHRPFRIDDWMLYECQVLSTGAGKGLVRGSIYDRNGVLVASVNQEGVVREKKK